MQCCVGSALANFPSANDPQVLDFPITLNASVTSPALSAVCRDQYRLSVVEDLLNLSRTVNHRICSGEMCPYVSRAHPGSGVRIAAGNSPFTSHEVFVAINTAALTDPVSFDVDHSTVSVSVNSRLILYSA